MRVTVFGGAGFIGSHLSDALCERGWQVDSVDIAEPLRPNPRVTYHHGDVRDPIDVACEIPQIVFNLAAVHRTPGHPDRQYYETNALGAVNVARWSRDVPVVIFTSSIAVYGAGVEAADDSTPLRPNSAYGKSKMLAEEIHRLAAKESGQRLGVFRPGVTFGAGEGGNFSRLAAALRARRMVLPGGPGVVKGCGYVKDLVAAMLYWVDGGYDSGTFNVAYPQPVTIGEIVGAFSRVAGYREPLHLPHALRSAVLAAPQKGAIARAAKLMAPTDVRPTGLVDLGFVWTTTLETALQDWQRESPRFT